MSDLRCVLLFPFSHLPPTSFSPSVVRSNSPFDIFESPPKKKITDKNTTKAKLNIYVVRIHFYFSMAVIGESWFFN